MNPDWLTLPVLYLVLSQRYPSTIFLNNQGISLFDYIHIGHENQRLLYKYLESNFHVSSVRYAHAQLFWKSYSCISIQNNAIKRRRRRTSVSECITTNLLHERHLLHAMTMLCVSFLLSVVIQLFVYNNIFCRTLSKFVA